MSERLVASHPLLSTHKLLQQLDEQWEGDIYTPEKSYSPCGPFGVFRVKDLELKQPDLDTNTTNLPMSDGGGSTSPEDGDNTVPNPMRGDLYDLDAREPTLSPWMRAMIGSIGLGDMGDGLPEPLQQVSASPTIQERAGRDFGRATCDINGMLQEDTLSPITQGVIQSILGQASSNDMDNYTFPKQSTVSNRVEELGDINGLDIEADVNEYEQADSMGYDMSSARLELEVPGIPPHLSMVSNVQQAQLLVHAVPLISHYGISVITAMSPHKHDHTPWHILFVPQLKDCLATLTLGDHLDEGSLTMFYGALAVSAMSLGVIHQSTTWHDLADAYRRQGSLHAHSMVLDLYADAKTAQYKKPLMALLTMAQVSYFSGESAQTESFLLEAERLVRLRGLARKKSRQVRLLHHCYAYMRLFHESMIVIPAAIESSHRREVRAAVEWSSVASHNIDSLSFRLMEWEDLQEAMMAIKDQFLRENDLHIGIPGLHVTSMYPEIFGIPEDYLFLLSQVIRLGNEKDLAENAAASGNALELTEFLKRAKAIEKGINKLCPRPLPNHSPNPLVLPNILDGMKCALLIYFYRRIYDVNPSSLQANVVAVRDWLLSHDQANPDFLYGSFGLIWPAFIAACEAVGPVLQASFSQWFRSAERRSGMVSFRGMLSTAERVWQCRNNPDTEDVTWLDIVRKS